MTSNGWCRNCCVSVVVRLSHLAKMNGIIITQMMYRKYGNGLVVPNGQKVNPRRVASRVWCDKKAHATMLSHKFSRGAWKMYCMGYIKSIITTGIVVKWKNGLRSMLTAFWNYKNKIKSESDEARIWTIIWIENGVRHNYR